MLIILLLIACGQNGKTPVSKKDPVFTKDPVSTEDPVGSAEVQLKSEEEIKLGRIAAIRKNGIPSAVIKALIKHNASDWDEEISHYYLYFVDINRVFVGVPYKVVGGNEFLYGDRE
ncbi:Putative membrane spanning protein (plasmid) [Borrelia crocidurae DOU]|uniref:Putative membrane spanning protein n=1 Tax=Borrelia crocidurae DOU TaxID=1293575 RepID=W5SL93_9SPIR|nr:hypothetical protein [Borrelia crocidurae]AHH07443.1 Putative membrane spanning protein [Borrelia crocidurae DOU]